MKKIVVAISGFVLGVLSVALIRGVFTVPAAQAYVWPNLSGVSEAVNNVIKKQKCLDIKGKIGQRAASANSFCTYNKGLLSNTSTKLSNTISKAEDKGYNISKLKQDANTFNDKIHDVNEYCDVVFIYTAASALTTQVCDNPDGNNTGFESLKDSIKAIRENTQKSINKIKETKKFYRETIKPDIYTVSQQKYVEE